MAGKSPNGVMTILVVVLVAIAGYAFFNLRNTRTGAEHVGDAVRSGQP